MGRHQHHPRGVASEGHRDRLLREADERLGVWQRKDGHRSGSLTTAGEACIQPPQPFGMLK